MKFGHIEIESPNPLELANFYINLLGFELEANQNDQFIWIQKGELHFLIKPGKATANHQLVFYSTDAAVEAAKLQEQGVGVELGPDNCYHFKDVDGHELQLVNPERDHSG